jgi:protease-4
MPTPKNDSFFRRLNRRTNLFARQTLAALANLRRWFFRSYLPHYVVITLTGELVERAPHLPWWTAFAPFFPVPASLESIDRALHTIAQDPDVQGVAFLFKGAQLRLAQAQSFAALIARFRNRDRNLHAASGRPPKQVIAFMEQANQSGYVAACAADRIIFTPLTTWDVLGVQAGGVYFKETLARLGVQAEVARISPWKSAADAMSEAAMSEEVRAQTNWLLDSIYSDVVAAIARGRRLGETDVRTLIDDAPLDAVEAMNCGLVDDVAYEDELPRLLGAAESPARLKQYARVRRLLLRRAEPRTGQRIGVINLSGAILPGESRAFPIALPLLGEAVMGSATVQRTVRAARLNKRLAAVIVVIDSPGGSALASDLMWRELSLLAAEKPLIVYMDRVAASGGYYIAAPAHTIIAQPATITGSIGVVTAKVTTDGLYEKLSARREMLRRGANAGLLSDYGSWNNEQRQKVEQSVRQVYHEFKQRVATGRRLDYNDLDDICNGRVWTGAQAKERGLVDDLGDFHTAYRAACRAVQLPEDGSVGVSRVVDPGSGLLAESVNAAAALLGMEQAAFWRKAAQAALRGDALALLDREWFWLLAEDWPVV